MPQYLNSRIIKIVEHRRPGHTCPRCGWNNVRPSPRRGVIDFALAILWLAPFRCRNCRERFFRFSRRVPTEVAMDVPPPIPQPHTEPPPIVTVAPPATPAPMSILIADSDLTIRKLLRKVLERNGYRVYATDPQNLTSQLQENSIDLLITDLDLPGEVGCEIIAELNKTNPNLKIVLLSALLGEEALRGKGLPPDLAVLSKPFRTESLIQHVRHALGQTSPGSICR